MSQFSHGHRLTHLGQFESLIWTRWLDLNIDKYFNYVYDVPVGKSILYPPDTPVWLKQDIEALSRKRIDVIFEDALRIYVCEVKHLAKPSVLGDLLAYRELYKLTYSPEKQIHLYLVTDSMDQGLKVALPSLGIRYDVLP
jgi:hypothetical protein